LGTSGSYPVVRQGGVPHGNFLPDLPDVFRVSQQY